MIFACVTGHNLLGDTFLKFHMCVLGDPFSCHNCFGYTVLRGLFFDLPSCINWEDEEVTGSNYSD